MVVPLKATDVPEMDVTSTQLTLSIAMLDYGHVLTIYTTRGPLVTSPVFLRGLLVVSGIWVPPKNGGCLQFSASCTHSDDEKLQFQWMGNGWLMVNDGYNCYNNG